MEFKVPKFSGISMPDMRQLTVDATNMFSRAVQVCFILSCTGTVIWLLCTA